MLQNQLSSVQSKTILVDYIRIDIAMIGGALGALLLFFQSLSFQVEWFNEHTINSFINFLTALAPLGFALYGV